jgi:alpha-glucuronidase
MQFEHQRNRTGFFICLIVFTQLFAAATAEAEDGYRLWLRYDPLPAETANAYRPRVTSVVVQGKSPTLDAVRTELVNGLNGLLGHAVPLASEVSGGAVVVGTPRSSPLVASLKLDRQLAALGTEGFIIRSVRLGRRAVTVIASDGETGALYGAFHFLRLLQTLQPIDRMDVSERPRLRLRVLDHRHCRRRLTRGCVIMRAPTPQSESTARCSTTSTPARRA